MNLCTAGNQSGKTSWMIIKNIIYATNTKLWPKIWPRLMKQKRPVTQFWYFYPDTKTANREFSQKWIKEWLPRGEAKEKGQYAWKDYYKQRDIERVDFLESNVSIYFFTYGQDAEAAQASTVYMVSVDEELPYQKFFGELTARLSATDGPFNAGFTATLGQDEWRRAMEEQGNYELFPEAFKKQISLYDCQIKEDGSPGLWELSRIKKQEKKYGTKNEVDKRVYGRFVKDSGLVFPAFDRAKNVVHLSDQKKLPSNWDIFSGIDIGSGGDKAHPAAISFVKVNPERTRGYLYKGWRGDGIVTTATDILVKYRELKGDDDVSTCSYDWSSAEFGIIASRAGEPVIKAIKSREEGNTLVNTLFRNCMFKIYEDEESVKLVNELNSLDVDMPKTKAKDDFTDSMRYAIMAIPWDFSCINAPETKDPDKYEKLDERETYRQKQIDGINPDQDLNDKVDAITAELDEANDYYGDDFNE